jgi:hypothetical protein
MAINFPTGQTLNQIYSYGGYNWQWNGDYWQVYPQPPISDSFVTGFTLGNNLVNLTQNRTDNYSSFTISLSAYTGNSSNIIQGITGLTGTSGVSASTTDYLTTIINTAPDKTVTITGGTNIQIISSYPNFGINFTGTTSGGTVTGDTFFTSGVSTNTLTANTVNFDMLSVSNFTEVDDLDVFGNSNFYIDANFLQDIIVSGILYSNTVSATTYLNYPDSYVTGFSLSSNTITLSQNRIDQYSAFTISLSANTGGGLNYYVLPSAPTGVTLNNGDRWFDTTTGAEVVYINDGDSRQWIQPNNAAQSSSPVSYYTASTYSSMIAFGTPANMTIIKVLNDENKSVSNAIYQVWPDGVRMWMAAIQDN